MKAYRRIRGIAPLIHDIILRRRYMVKLTDLQLYLRERTSVPTECEAGWTPYPIFKSLII
jgi:hypothetical protein